MSDHRTASAPKTVGYETPAEPPRRSFLYHALTAVVGGIVALVPLAAGLATYFDPLLRKKSKADAMLPVTTLDKIPDASKADVLIGRFPIMADRNDAWNKYPNEPVGGVYLVVPKGTHEVKALQMTCPHLGCAVDVQSTGDTSIFKCPCHTSAFTLTGERIMPCVSARNMDELKCEVKTVGGKQEVFVQFQNFQPGLEAKKVKA
jgi:menaquinol-cytochrome c reductase iron-sulfur subunit